MSGPFVSQRVAGVPPVEVPPVEPGQSGQPGGPGWVPPVRESHRPLLTSLTLSSPAGEIDLMQKPWRVVKARGLTTVTRAPTP